MTPTPAGRLGQGATPDLTDTGWQTADGGPAGHHHHLHSTSLLLNYCVRQGVALHTVLSGRGLLTRYPVLPSPSPSPYAVRLSVQQTLRLFRAYSTNATTPRRHLGKLPGTLSQTAVFGARRNPHWGLSSTGGRALRQGCSSFGESSRSPHPAWLVPSLSYTCSTALPPQDHVLSAF